MLISFLVRLNSQDKVLRVIGIKIMGWQEGQERASKFSPNKTIQPFTVFESQGRLKKKFTEC